MLEKAIELSNEGLVALKYAPRFDSLLSDSRFRDLLRKMNLEQHLAKLSSQASRPNA